MTVTAEILPAPTPPSTVQPRVVKSPTGLNYRLVNGRFEHNSDHAIELGWSWLYSEYNRRKAIELDGPTLAFLADLKGNPTETITPPAGEDTVVLRMPRNIAEAVAALVGNVIGRGPIRQQLDEVFDVLDSALDPDGTATIASPFDDVTRIREELQ